MKGEGGVTVELGEKVRPLPGVSAYRYGAWGWIPNLIGVALLPVALVIYVLTGSSAGWQSPFVWVAGLLGFGLIGVSFLFVLASRVKGRRESAHGYTTMVRDYRHLKQVDPRSGVVIRCANDPFLTRKPDGFNQKPRKDRPLSPH